LLRSLFLSQLNLAPGQNRERLRHGDLKCRALGKRHSSRRAKSHAGAFAKINKSGSRLKLLRLRQSRLFIKTAKYIPRIFRDVLKAHLQKHETFKIAARDCRYEFGFGFDGLYHPYVEALKLDNEKDAERLLYEFYLSLNVYLNSFLSPKEALAVQLWKHEKSALANMIASRGFRLGQFEGGTLSPRDAAHYRASHLYAIKRSISAFGYVPNIQGFDSGIDGIYIGQKFLVLGGQHRAAVLYSMGENVFKVQMRKNHGSVPVYLNPCGESIDLDVVKSGILLPLEVRNVLRRIEKGISKSEAMDLNFPFG